MTLPANEVTIHLYEPDGMPRRSTLRLRERDRFMIYAFLDPATDSALDLRATLMRRAGTHPPPGARLLVEFTINEARPGELPVLDVRELGVDHDVYLIRTGSRGRLSRGHDVKSGARFEAVADMERPLRFSIEVASDAVKGKGLAVGTAKSGGSQAVAGIGSLIWVVPNVVEAFAEPRAKVVAFFQAAAKRMGISRVGISSAMVALPTLVLLGGGAWAYYADADYKQQIADLNEKLGYAQATTDAALVAEQSCKTQRAELTKRLGDEDAARRLQAELAMETTKAQTVSLTLGQARMSTDEVMEFDGVAVPAFEDLVVDTMVAMGDPYSFASVCLAQENVLGQDLPRFLLTWHPSPDVLCPPDFDAVIDGVAMVGFWGLSERVAREFGAPVGDDAGDPRANERWAAAAYTDAMKSVVETVLTLDTGDRPPVLPGQAHLWSLAMFDAYNRLPSPADGSMDRPMAECLEEALLEIAAKSEPAEPGQPVLPPLHAVAAGAAVPVTPTSGCPWPSNVLATGANSALRAVTNLAMIQQKVEQGETEEEG